jgi:hypothetical protein
MVNRIFFFNKTKLFEVFEEKVNGVLREDKEFQKENFKCNESIEMKHYDIVYHFLSFEYLSEKEYIELMDYYFKIFMNDYLECHFDLGQIDLNSPNAILIIDEMLNYFDHSKYLSFMFFQSSTIETPIFLRPYKCKEDKPNQLMSRITLTLLRHMNINEQFVQFIQTSLTRMTTIHKMSTGLPIEINSKLLASLWSLREINCNNIISWIFKNGLYLKRKTSRGICLHSTNGNGKH